MNAGIVTSFVISGILLLAILAMNLNISRSSTELTMRQITQQRVETVSDFLNYDFPKIGFDTFGKVPDAIKVAESNRIEFESNIDNSGSVEYIQWIFDTSAPVTAGTNPDDYILYRIEDGVATELKTGVTKFHITYFNNNLDSLATPVSSQSDRNNIRHIQIKMTIESREKVGEVGASSTDYLKSLWDKTFSPKNLGN